MTESFDKILVTGGAGFIGSHFVDYVLSTQPETRVRVLDKFTYAGNPANLESARENERFELVEGDICDAEVVEGCAADVDAIINFAAETHVDRSIAEPEAFLKTDILGTQVLIEAARRYNHKRYLQISTDEVYGSIESGSFTEESPLCPSSPYSASKAGADHLVQSYFVTYGLPVLITRSSNNYGPRQYPEKIIPLFITNALDDQSVPLYGDGLNVRDWLYVEDNCSGFWAVLTNGRPGEVYNLGGGEERTNLEVTRGILEACGKGEDLIRRAADRPGHDRRYSIACDRARSLGWAPVTDFETGLARTVNWYSNRRDWWEPIKSGEFKDYYRKQYSV